MTNKLEISISPKVDLVVTQGNQIAISQKENSSKPTYIIIGILNDETLEHLSYAIQRLRIHT